MKEYSESVKTSNYFTESGMMIFLFTIVTYYFVAKKTEIEYKLLNIPSQFIDYPFYNLVTQLEGLMLEFLPLIIFLILIILMSKERLSFLYFSKNNLYISDRFKAKNEKPYSKRFIITLITTLIGFGWLSFSLDDSQTILNFMENSVLVTFIALLIFALFKWISFMKQGSRVTLKTERLYTKFLFYFIIIVVYGHLLISVQIILDLSKPYQTVVKNVAIINDEDRVKYQFEFLAAEKNGYSVWAYAEIEKPSINRTVQLEISKKFKVEKMENIEVSYIELSKKLITESGDKPELRLRFNTWDEAVSSLNASLN